MAASSTTKRVPPPILFGVAWCFQRLFMRRTRETTASKFAGGIIAAGSLAIAGSAIMTMLNAGTQLRPEHPEKSAKLVTAGPFKFTRNPIYVAFAGLLLGHAVSKRSMLALAPLAGFVSFMNRTQIPAEEQALEAKFGKPYTQYLQDVPRWLS